MANNGVQRIKLFLDTIVKHGGFDKGLSRVNVISGGNGNLTASLKLEKEDCNVSGNLHGGAAALIVDNLSSAGLFTHPSPYVGFSGVSVQLNMTYLKAVALGEEILIKSTTDKVGKSLAFMTVEILNKKNGDLIAKGTHTKFIGGQQLNANSKL